MIHFDPWDLISQTRYRTHGPCSGRLILTHWTSTEVPGVLLYYSSGSRVAGVKGEGHHLGLWYGWEWFQSALRNFKRGTLKTPAGNRSSRAPGPPQPFSHRGSLYINFIDWAPCKMFHEEVVSQFKNYIYKVWKAQSPMIATWWHKLAD